jgi:predicted transcriptional regulator
MGASKSDSFNENQNRIAVLAKALGHPARVAILQYLMRVEGCICDDIVNELPLAQPTISQHLKELKTAGIIQGTVEGNAICYCIAQGCLEPLRQFIQIIDIHLQKQNSNCC